MPSPIARSRAAISPSGWPTALDGEVVTTAGGRFVRVEGGRVALPRGSATARRPARTAAAGPRRWSASTRRRPGLATAAGTVAFLIGLGWWQGDRFRQVQLLLPDHADERALLDELAGHIPATPGS